MQFHGIPIFISKTKYLTMNMFQFYSRNLILVFFLLAKNPWTFESYKNVIQIFCTTQLFLRLFKENVIYRFLELKNYFRKNKDENKFERNFYGIFIWSIPTVNNNKKKLTMNLKHL